MEKRYVCFTCHHCHPEMRGVSEEEFQAGDNVCQEEKCKYKGQPLEVAEWCEPCGKLFRAGTHMAH